MQYFWGYVKIALDSLWSNKTRTLLTTLGIIIGVASILTLLGVGKAAQDWIESSFESFGSDNIYILPGNREGSFSGPPGLTDNFTLNEIEQFERYSKRYIDKATAGAFGMYNAKYLTKDKFIELNSYTSGSYIDLMEYKADIGRMVNQQDMDQYKKVTTIGPKVADTLFEDEDPIGKDIKVGNVNFQVVGVFESKGSSSFQDQDDVIIVPYSAFYRYLLKKDKIAYIIASAKDPELVEYAKTEADEIFSKIRRIREGDDKTFSISDAGEFLETIQQVTGIFTIFLAAIAAISLLVGGIGVMNIMFVSITERTKEIGLRKSLGARNRDILFQFLTESIIVTMLGGLGGMALGVGLSTILSKLASLGSSIYIDSIILAVVFSIIIGLVFGIYPAKKASKLNPIDALRYE
ncbi:FtsX-like permease family protein [Candidatus Dojkabacteria bacterium]|nr:FtsX-like permease family protein [Candidatus Dojkabacteria bacterium]